MVAIAAMVAEILAVSKISADHGPAASELLRPSRRLPRTTRRVEIPGIVALRKVVEAVIKVAAVAVIAALRHPAVGDRVAAVVAIAVAADPVAAVVAIAVAADPVAVVAATAAADPVAEAMAGSRANLTTYIY
jgi:hypothetical protein